MRTIGLTNIVLIKLLTEKLLFVYFSQPPYAQKKRKCNFFLFLFFCIEQPGDGAKYASFSDVRCSSLPSFLSVLTWTVWAPHFLNCLITCLDRSPHLLTFKIYTRFWKRGRSFLGRWSPLWLQGSVFVRTFHCLHISILNNGQLFFFSSKDPFLYQL